MQRGFRDCTFDRSVHPFVQTEIFTYPLDGLQEMLYKHSWSTEVESLLTLLIPRLSHQQQEPSAGQSFHISSEAGIIFQVFSHIEQMMVQEKSGSPELY